MIITFNWTYIVRALSYSYMETLRNLESEREEILYIIQPRISQTSVVEMLSLWFLPYFSTTFISAQFSLSVMSDSLQPHESQHARPPCPSPTPRVYSNSCPSSRWCHPAISSSVIPFSSCPQSLQHQGLFQWVNTSHKVAKVLEFQLQHQFFQWTPRTDLL